jgi:hypothetical protein
MKRKVKGIIHNLSDRPWGNALVTFDLMPGGYNLTTVYPGQSISVKTDAAGAFECDLWCNEEGRSPTTYRCSIGDGESFTFTLPIGTDEVNLITLRELGVKPFPTPTKPKTREIRDIFIPDNGQVTFTLSRLPMSQDLSFVWLNGVKLVYGRDYMLDGLVLSWLPLVPRLESSDVLETVYFIEV